MTMGDAWSKTTWLFSQFPRILLPLRCCARTEPPGCMSAMSSLIQHDTSATSYRVALTRSVKDHLYETCERSFIIVSPANMKELKFRAARKLFWIQSAHLMLSNKKCNIFPHSCSTTILWVETPAAVSRARYAAELQRAFLTFLYWSQVLHWCVAQKRPSVNRTNVFGLHRARFSEWSNAI